MKDSHYLKKNKRYYLGKYLKNVFPWMTTLREMYFEGY